MKTHRIFITINIILLIIFSSCENLDQDITVTLTEDEVTASYEYTKYRALSIYTEINNGFDYIDGAMLASASDEAEHTLEISKVQGINTGNWNAVYNPDDVWEHYYQAIRKVNRFLATADDVNLDTYKLDPDESAQAVYQSYLADIENWKAEARFLRAYFYLELIKRYGGVPLINSVTTINDDNSNIKRESLNDCIDFIISECSTVAELLPEQYADEELGRVTKGCALSLKSRVLLYTASNLFNDPSWASGYSNTDLISVTGDRATKWKEAAMAAKAVIDLGIYSLSFSYSDIFGSAGYLNNEIIFARRNAVSNSFEIASTPVGYDLGESGTTPSQNLVDCYQMTDGSDFDWNNPAHAAAPYENRDPRLAYTILTNNTNYKNRPVECWTGGLDGKGVQRATRTGYYLLKYVNTNLDLLQSRTSAHSWVIFRLAEIYLNYAEALNEYEPGNADILKYLNLVRSRADVNMPAIPSGLSQEKMRELIRNERRVELAFENHRFWDVRRWMLGENYFNSPLKGVEITKNEDNFSYEVIDVEDRTFEPKMYFYPIPQNEINISANWVQNPLW